VTWDWWAEAGKRLLLGLGVSQDETLGLACMKKSILLGRNASSFELGAIYKRGLNGVPDIGKAIEYFCDAGEAGCARAWRVLAEMFQSGDGCDKNEELASEFLERACLVAWAQVRTCSVMATVREVTAEGEESKRKVENQRPAAPAQEDIRWVENESVQQEN
jgi:hypothetical protein